MIRERRNNALSGVVVLIGALLFGFGALRPWAQVQTGVLDIKAGSLNLSVVPNMSAAKGQLQSVVLALAGLVGLCGLLLIATRARGLGVLWRLVGLAGLVPAGALAYYLWTVALSDNPSAVLNDAQAGITDKLTAVLGSLLRRTGLIKLTPGQGLYLMTIGVALAFVGLCLPASRSMENLGKNVPSQRDIPPQTHPPGWYPVNERGETLYWDGGRWAEH